MKNFIKYLLIFVIFIFNAPVFAENFYIEKYDVNLNVDKYKSVQIIEDIYANFTHSSHGIIRTIPFENASISDISVSEKFNVEKEAKRVNIKIGDPKKFVYGKVHYTIKYKYNYQDNKNEFYHNVIGTKWSVPIEKVTFKLVLPEKINPDLAGISIGKYGTKGFKEGAKYTIKEGRIVEFETTKALKPYEGVTFRVPVREDYFYKYYNPMEGVTKFLIIFYTLLSLIIWFKFGKDKHVTSVVSFELPEGTNSFDAELISKENVSTKGLVALLVELASKGYVKINSDEKGFVLHKLKDYEDKNTLEWDFMNAIFGMKNTVSENKLKKSHTYYEKCEKLIEKYKEKSKQKYFEKKSISVKLFRISLFCVVGLIFCIMATLCNFHIKQMLLPDRFLIELLKSIIAGEPTNSFIVGLVLVIPSYGLLATLFFEEFNKLCFTSLSSLFLLLLFFLWVFDYTNCTNYQCLYIALMCLIVSMICTKNLPRKNSNGIDVMGQLKGLKKYIKVCQEHELNAMAEENPAQFYNILPYAYILGISDIWISKLKKIMENNSQIFEDAYIVNNFSSFTTLMSNYSQPTYENGGISSSSGGSYSSSSGGGGYSGGGGGGGGGSSW